MMVTFASKRRIAFLLTVLAAAAGCSSGGKTSGPATTTAAVSGSSTVPSSTTSAVVVTSSRGFDGTTIKVAGIGILSQEAGTDVGTEARFKRANDTNELNGIKLKYVEFANDQDSPATALSEARRLVTQDQVFAIVPDVSPVNPVAYFASQHVPYIGWAFDATYCSPTPSTSLWGFGYDGCLVPSNPPTLPDGYGGLYKYVSAKSGKAHPSVVMFSSDNQAGKDSTRLQASSVEGAGFNVLYAKGSVPMQVSDYTPYVQQWLSADGGKQPDALLCLVQVQCIQVWAAVKAAGFTGVFYQTLGPIGALAKPLAGTLTAAYYNTQPGTGLSQMEADLQAFKPGTQPIGYSNVAGYFAADMFIQALKKVGRDITPEAVQQALATQTWQIPGLVGPTIYPASTVGSYPACVEVLQDDGTNFNVISPYTCSYKTFPVDSKFTG